MSALTVARMQAAGELAAGATTAGQEPDAAAREQALSEMATGCYRLITARLAPTVQRWIRTLAKVTPALPGTAACCRCSTASLRCTDRRLSY